MHVKIRELVILNEERNINQILFICLGEEEETVNSK